MDPNLNDSTVFLDSILKRVRQAGGIFVIASYGQAPATGRDIAPKIWLFKSTATSAEILRAIFPSLKDLHRNFYWGVSTRKLGLPFGCVGKESELEQQIAGVLDFDLKDDPNAHKWAERCKAQPDFVIETSPGSFQIVYIFDRPYPPSEAKVIISAITDAVGCDKSGKSPAHVFRLPGTYNWPNKVKLAAGRSPEPFLSRLIEGAASAC